MLSSTMWWWIAAVLFGLELLSGTLYFVGLAVGAAVAATAASLGVGVRDQMVLASAIGGLLVVLRHVRLQRRGHFDVEGRNTTGLGDLDVGQEVRVQRWNPDGTTQVRYRGEHWHATHFGPHLPRKGKHRILAIEPTHLVLEPITDALPA